MPRKATELKAIAVQRLTEPGRHPVGGVAGLYLQVQPPPSNARSWILRTVIGGRRRDMGLGGYPDVTLAQARAAAQEKRADVGQGVDPIEKRRKAVEALRETQRTSKTFEQAARAYIKAHEVEWRNAKHAAQWLSTLENIAFPKIGSKLVRDVGLSDVLSVLEPIWTTRTETASRLRGRIEKVLDWAGTRGYRDGLNPARWRGHLSNQLPAPRKIAKTTKHKALPVDEICSFMRALSSQDGMGARALEFAILTAARSGEVRGATFAEFDLDGAVWTVPAERMKARVQHRVPLSAPAVALVKAQQDVAASEFVFAAPRGGALSDMSLLAVVRRMGIDAVPHGFRSTFRDWAGEKTNYPNEVVEMALAHTIKNKTEAAYRRGDMLERRAPLMNDWATFCGAQEVKATKGKPRAAR